jgi:KDO2-lipid IV(A) lauroyltransferase
MPGHAPLARRVADAARHRSQYAAARSFAWLFGAFPPEQNLRTARAVADAWAALNPRRLDRARENVRNGMPHLGAAEVDGLALESVRYMFRMYMVDAFQLPRLLTEETWPRYLDLSGARAGIEVMVGERPALFVAPHAGNWELLGFFPTIMGFRMHALARPLANPHIWQWALSMREARGMRIITKWGATEQLQSIVERGGRIAFIADQNAGDDGVFVPYFGQMASAYKSVALLAMRYGLPIVVGIALRRGEAFEYALHTVDVIRPDDWAGQDDPVFYVTARYNRAMEKAIMLDPAQYLWIHRRWRSRPRWERDGKQMPDRVLAKLRTLPWMDDAAIDRLRADTERRLRAAHHAAA